MSLSDLNPNIVKTAIDKLFFQKWDFENSPGYMNVESSALYNQEGSDRAAEIHETNQGVGLWEEKGQDANAPADNWIAKNQTTYTHVTFAKSIDLSKEYFDDDQHTQTRRNISDLARKGRQTQNQQGFATYRNAFNAAFPGADGVSLINPAHPIKTGTESNEVASNPLLTEVSLNTAIVQMREQKDQAGVIMGNVPRTLFTSPADFKNSAEIIDSELRSSTADNDINVYSSKYGIMIANNEWIGATGGGSDVAWYLLAADFGLFRYVREGLMTNLLDWRITRNHNYIYSARYRESTGFSDYAGIVGSDGTEV